MEIKHLTDDSFKEINDITKRMNRQLMQSEAATMENKEPTSEGFGEISDIIKEARTLTSADLRYSPIGVNYFPGPCTGFAANLRFKITLSQASDPYARYIKNAFHFYNHPSENIIVVIIKGASHLEWIMFRIKLLMEDIIEEIYDFDGQPVITQAMRNKACVISKRFIQRLHSTNCVIKAMQGRYTNCQPGSSFIPSASHVCVCCGNQKPPSPAYIDGRPICRHESSPYGNMIISNQPLARQILRALGGPLACKELSESGMTKLFDEFTNHQ